MSLFSKKDLSYLTTKSIPDPMQKLSTQSESIIKLHHGDCLEIMPTFAEHSIDLIICDLPYAKTHNEWDQIIPMSKLWSNYHRLIKPNGAIILFGQGSFSAQLICSNLEDYRYTLIWDKVLPSGFLNAKKIPLPRHEDILVFYQKLPTYNPQMVVGDKPSHRRGKLAESKGMIQGAGKVYGAFIATDKCPSTETNLKYPTSIVRFSKPGNKAVHPTQKPVELLEWLVATYSNAGDMVLDNCMGSGTTGIACKHLGRNFTGIELEQKYFNLAQRRISEE